jgi:hypothetical protein
MTTMDSSISNDRIPSARNNNLVAESDYRAALTALREKLHSSPSSDPVVRRLLTDCSNSLERNIQKIVQPISDEAYHLYLSRFKDSIPTFPSSELVDAAATEGTITNVIEDIEEECFEEEDLLDQVAVARVQELRQQVREQAARMVQLRCETVRRAVTLTERQVQLWEKQQLTAATPFHDNDAVAALLEPNKAALEDMKTSFSNLHQTLQETGSVIPSQLQLFQSTLQDIELSLQNQQQKQLSQIEQAIFSRDDVLSTTEDTPMEEECRALDPEQQLAHLLCHN